MIIKEGLSKRYFTRRQVINNIFIWTGTILKLLLIIHLFSASIIYEKTVKTQKDKVFLAGDPCPYDRFECNKIYYYETFYFTTTTLTTVGYGDYSSDPNTVSRITIILIQMIGLLAFSMISSNIFTYEEKMTVQKLVARKVQETTEFLNEMSLSRRGVFLLEWMYNDAQKSIENSLRLSTRIAFEDIHFFKNMSVQL